MKPHDLMEKVEKAVRAAGRIIRDTRLDESHITVKGTANFATLVDFEVQSYLMQELAGIIPGSNVITEESEDNRFNLDSPTWVLDPVDGTTNLMYGCRMSAISIALYIGQKPELGIIFNPESDEMFTAEAGKGAFLNGRSISVSRNGRLQDSLIGFGTTPYDKTKSLQTFERVHSIFTACRDVRRSGSAALDIAYVACGRLDGFFELNLQPWDYDAGIIILKEAGGRITRFSGEEINVLKQGSVLASNGLIHEQLQNIIR